MRAPPPPPPPLSPQFLKSSPWPLCIEQHQGELREYVSRIGQTWREDPSNDSLKYKRNRVRHELVPIMADLAGGMGPLAQRLETMSKQSSAYRDWLGAAALAWEVEYVPEGSAHRARHVLPVEPLQHTSSPVQIEVIHRFIARSPHLLPFSAAASLPYDQMERVLSQLSVPSVDWSLHLTKAISVRRVGEVLKCGSVEEDTEEYEEQRSFCSSESEEKNLSVRVSSRVVRALARVGCSLAISMVDDAPGGDSGSTSIHVWPGARLAVRLREDGDRFVVAGTAEGNGRQKKVSEILRDRNVPLHLREDVIVLEALRKDPPNLLAMWVPDAMDPAGWNALVAHEGDEEVVDMAEEAAAMATTVYFSLKVKK
jgi:tRNA(Ile)-lysidine synthetase-like protein